MTKSDYVVIDPRYDLLDLADVSTEKIKCGKKLQLASVELGFSVKQLETQTYSVSLVFYPLDDSKELSLGVEEILEPIDIGDNVVVSGAGFISRNADDQDRIAACLFAFSVKEVTFKLDGKVINCDIVTAHRTIGMDIPRDLVERFFTISS